MRIVAHSAGMEEDEYDDVMEAGFTEGEDGSGIGLLFQRGLSDPDPWEGELRNPNDLVNNTYCLTTPSGQTAYGGLREVAFSGDTGTFTFEPRVARTLQLEEELQVRFAVAADDLADFKSMLRRVVTWGVPSEVPQLDRL